MYRLRTKLEELELKLEVNSGSGRLADDDDILLSIGYRSYIGGALQRVATAGECGSDSKCDIKNYLHDCSDIT